MYWQTQVCLEHTCTDSILRQVLELETLDTTLSPGSSQLMKCLVDITDQEGYLYLSNFSAPITLVSLGKPANPGSLAKQ